MIITPKSPPVAPPPSPTARPAEKPTPTPGYPGGSSFEPAYTKPQGAGPVGQVGPVPGPAQTAQTESDDLFPGPDFADHSAGGGGSTAVGGDPDPSNR